MGRKIVHQLETGFKIVYVRDALRTDCTLFDLQETFGERVGRLLFLVFVALMKNLPLWTTSHRKVSA